MEETSEQSKTLDKINQLLSLREAKESDLKQLNHVLKQGFEKAACFPRRWYVQGPNRETINYLKDKYQKVFSYNPDSPIDQKCGYGEMYGEFAFIPHDISHSWRITQEEFDFILKIVQNAGK